MIGFAVMQPTSQSLSGLKALLGSACLQALWSSVDLAAYWALVDLHTMNRIRNLKGQNAHAYAFVFFDIGRINENCSCRDDENSE